MYGKIIREGRIYRETNNMYITACGVWSVGCKDGSFELTSEIAYLEAPARDYERPTPEVLLDLETLTDGL